MLLRCNVIWHLSTLLHSLSDPHCSGASSVKWYAGSIFQLVWVATSSHSFSSYWRRSSLPLKMKHHFFITAWLSQAVLYFLLTLIWKASEAFQTVAYSTPYTTSSRNFTRLLLEGSCLGLWQLRWELFSCCFSAFSWIFCWRCWCTLPCFSLCVLHLPFAIPFLTTSLHGCATVCNCRELVASVSWETSLEIFARVSELPVHVDWVAWRAALSSAWDFTSEERH